MPKLAALPEDVFDVMYDAPIAIRNAVGMLKPLCAGGQESAIAFAILETVAFRTRAVLADHWDAD